MEERQATAAERIAAVARLLEQARRRREVPKEIVLGSILLVGGLAYTLGIRELTGGEVHYASYGAIGLGTSSA